MILASLAVAIRAPKRWWRARSNAKGASDATCSVRKEGAIFYDSLTADSWSSRWHSRWNSGTVLRVTASLLFQEIKPLLSKTLPDGSRFSAFSHRKKKKKRLQGISLIHCVNICNNPFSSWLNAANAAQQWGTGAASTASGQGSVCKRIPKRNLLLTLSLLMSSFIFHNLGSSWHHESKPKIKQASLGFSHQHFKVNANWKEDPSESEEGANTVHGSISI